MKKLITLTLLLLFTCSINSYAHDSERIDQLEQRILKLESMLNNPDAPQGIITSGNGWKSISNWRKLEVDMSYDEVRKILGEPHKLDGGTVANWSYKNGGRVVFVGGELSSWYEPVN